VTKEGRHNTFEMIVAKAAARLHPVIHEDDGA
jgi:hypothetical protein